MSEDVTEALALVKQMNEEQGTPLIESALALAASRIGSAIVALAINPFEAGDDMRKADAAVSAAFSFAIDEGRISPTDAPKPRRRRFSLRRSTNR